MKTNNLKQVERSVYKENNDRCSCTVRFIEIKHHTHCNLNTLKLQKPKLKLFTLEIK